MTAPHARSARQPRQMDAGPLLSEIMSFRLHLAAEDKSAKTIRTYSEAAAGSPPLTSCAEGREVALAAGGQAGRPAVDGLAAGPVQRLLRQ